MRKWMNERLKRRKKGGDRTPKEQASPNSPEPLQPKYFESELGEQPHAAAAVEQPHSERTPETQADFQLVVPTQSDAEPAAVAPTSAARTGPVRRRRKRGGRGGARRGAGQGSAAQGSPTSDAAGRSAELAHAAPLTPESATPSMEQSPVAAAASPRAAAPVATAAAARPSKGTVVLAIGLPGSGKSSWFKRHSIHPLSSDLLRELLFDDALEQRFQDLVFSNLRSMLKARLIARRPMNYVDATNLTPHDRHSWIKLAKDYGYDVQGLFFDVPLEVCLERHQRRGRAVPEDVMRKMAGKLKPPTFEEGFSKITVVRVKQKENVES
jgi:predicted kinase